MTYEEILSRFAVKKKQGDKAQCICPAHNDKAASLSISQGSNGVVLHCFAGCDSSDILGAVGLTMRDLYEDSGAGIQTGELWRSKVENWKKDKIVGVYRYVGIDGKYAFTRLRFQKKDFIYGIEQGEQFNFGLSKKSRKDIPAVYVKSLGELKRAIEAGERIYYCEGEKDVNTVNSHGLLGVTCGASGDWIPECSPLFKGADLVILQDNDEGGAKLTEQLQADLSGVAKSIRVVIPTPDIEKGDISDFLKDHSIEDLEKLIQDQAAVQFQEFNPIAKSGGGFEGLPDFPLDTLPEDLRDYAMQTAEYLQVDVAMVCNAMLSTVAAACMGVFSMEPKEGWKEPLNLYSLTIASPSERKSPTLSEVIKPVRDYENRWNEEHEKDIKQSQRQKTRLEARVASLSRKYANATKDTKSIQAQLKDAEAELDDFKEIHPLRIITAGDVTSEALTKMMGLNNERMYVVDSEGDLLEIVRGRYSDKPSPQIFLNAYFGEPYTSNRITREEIRLQNPKLCVSLCSQPEAVKRVMEDGLLNGRGFFQRFLLSVPKSCVGSRQYDTSPADPEKKKAYNSLIDTLYGIQSGEWEHKQLKPVITWSEAADRQSKALFSECEGLISAAQANGESVYEGWLGKMHGTAMRMAGILHVMHEKAGAGKKPVPGQRIKEAREIMLYYAQHARAVFKAYCKSPEDQGALKIWAVILETQADGEAALQDVYQKARDKGAVNTRRDLDDILSVLNDHGYTSIDKRPTKSKPKEVIIINPAAVPDKA